MTVTETEKILIVGPSWVGDMVMAQSLFISLRQRYPGAVIDVLAPAWCGPLIKRMPEVRRLITMPTGHGELALGKRYRLGKSLRGAAYGKAYILPNSFKSALVPWFAKIPQRIAWRGEMRRPLLSDCRVLNKQDYPLMVERFVALAYARDEALPSQLPYPCLEVLEAQRSATVQKFGLSLPQKVLALCPGAEFGPAKRWPAKHYAAVAAAAIDVGWQVWIFGSEKDGEAAADILGALSAGRQTQCRILCGKTSLEEAIDLLSLADAVVSNDSGLMHIAAALNRALVVIYGSTSPAFTPPLSERVEVVSLSLDCSPCFKRECPLQHLACLEDLSPGPVLQALEKVSGDTFGVPVVKS